MHELFNHLISNLVIIFYLLNTFLSLCWFLIYFHLWLKGIPLLYILIKSHWSAVVFRCSGIKLIPVPCAQVSLQCWREILMNTRTLSIQGYPSNL